MDLQASPERTLALRLGPPISMWPLAANGSPKSGA